MRIQGVIAEFISPKKLVAISRMIILIKNIPKIVVVKKMNSGDYRGKSYAYVLVFKNINIHTYIHIFLYVRSE
jgi:hypothetical protein